MCLISTVPPIPASVDENLVTPQCSAWISCCKPYPNITCWKMNKEEYLTELPNNIRNSQSTSDKNITSCLTFPLSTEMHDNFVICVLDNDIINTNSTLKPGGEFHISF